MVNNVVNILRQYCGGKCEGWWCIEIFWFVRDTKMGNTCYFLHSSSVISQKDICRNAMVWYIYTNHYPHTSTPIMNYYMFTPVWSVIGLWHTIICLRCVFIFSKRRINSSENRLTQLFTVICPKGPFKPPAKI